MAISLCFRKIHLWIALIITATLILSVSHFFEYIRSSFSINSISANSTLGFGTILAVSSNFSNRRIGLISAANVTEIDITIPEQPNWMEENKVDLSNTKITKGSVLAMLSHLNVLEWFLESGVETALILEDDVDWDVRLRSIQIPALAAVTRSIRSPVDPQKYYYGHPSEWDLLYIGNCGDYLRNLQDGVGVGYQFPPLWETIPHQIYPDKTVLDRHLLHPFTSSFLTAFMIPEKMRLLYESRYPLCSFGYAVTRDAAWTLIDKIGEKFPNTEAFDVELLKECSEKGSLRCMSVNPELFHHKPANSLIDSVNKDAIESFVPHKPPVDEAGENQAQYRNETSNISCGFWKEAFAWSGDLERLEYLRAAARAGLCLKDEK